jgi:DNA-binding XRE family transcriptional regulator
MPRRDRSSTAEMVQCIWGERVKATREDRKRTQMWLARQVGVDQKTISRIEKGRYTITPTVMIRIATALDADLNKLFGFPAGLVSRERFERGTEKVAS